MSFILEALRKSESERQRLGNAAIADLPVARRQRSQPWWIIAIAILLVVNIGVLVVVLMRDPAPQQVASAPAQTTQPAQVAVVTTPPRSVLEEEAAPAPQVEYETVPRSEMEIAEAAASVPEGPTLVQPATSNQPVTPAAALPAADGDLQLNLHVYAQNSRERFVLINMRRYLEGEALPNGATIEQITPSGVILYRDGQRYELRR